MRSPLSKKIRDHALVAVALLVGGQSIWAAPPTGPEVAELETANGERILVRKGDVIPGLGEVTAIDSESVMVERVLTEEERDERKRRGVLAPNVEQRIYDRALSSAAIQSFRGSE